MSQLRKKRNKISSSSSALKSNKHKRDWLDLPSDVTANILQRIGAIDILENAQKVCMAWRKICKDDPSMWTVIKIDDFKMSDETRLCLYKQAVDRSQGQLLDITLLSCTSQLLAYVTNISTELRRLEIVSHYSDVHRRISEALTKLPFLEELNLYAISVTVRKDFIETLGRYCPMLKTLKVNETQSSNLRCEDDANEIAIAIGKNLHELRHLELIGNDMTNIGLQVILDGCLSLETLDLRKCFEIDLDEDLRKRCFKQIKSLKLPHDSLEGIPYSYIYEDDSKARVALYYAHVSRYYTPRSPEPYYNSSYDVYVGG